MACSFSSEQTELPAQRFSQTAASVQRFVARHWLAAWAAVEAARCLCDEASQKQAEAEAEAALISSQASQKQAEAEAEAALISSQASQKKAEGAAACFAATAWAAKPAIVYAEAEPAKQKRKRGGRRDLAF